ncbi:MAG: SPOR domain-containing protein [Desulfobacteraceae bacterium]|nr:SPOR domain-containing protein [Desulfobacteraceae bacterium]
MFFLGIMVGRGSSPVTFDTQKFQKRLGVIVEQLEKKDGPEKKVDLQFYDVLDEPFLQEVAGKQNNPDEIIPKKQTQVVPSGVPVKTSRKKVTWHKAFLNKRLSRDTPGEDDGPGSNLRAKSQVPATDLHKLASKKIIEKKSPAFSKDSEKAGDFLDGEQLPSGVYTVQIAAYKSFADAVTQMAVLRKKGFVPYRTLGKSQGVTWYRVRMGAFATRDAAARYVEKLKQAKIKAMIIKKE